MAKYISNTDLYGAWGENNIITWSDLDGGRELDQTRVDAAMNWAEAYIENRFRRTRYAVPFSIGSSGTYDLQLTDWMASLAGNKLYKGRSSRRGQEQDDRTSAVLKRVAQEIAQVLGGQLEIDTGATQSALPTGPFVVT